MPSIYVVLSFMAFVLILVAFIMSAIYKINYVYSNRYCIIVNTRNSFDRYMVKRYLIPIFTVYVEYIGNIVMDSDRIRYHDRDKLSKYNGSVDYSPIVSTDLDILKNMYEMKIEKIQKETKKRKRMNKQIRIKEKTTKMEKEKK